MDDAPEQALDHRCEWLEADGLGGYAMGSTGLARDRRYHALLCTATAPPTGRRVLVAGVDAVLHTDAGTCPLSAQRYRGGVLHPRGDEAIVSFAAEPWPTWEFHDAATGTRVAFELFVPKDHSAVVLRWRLLAAPAGRADLVVRPFLAGRDHHALVRDAATPGEHVEPARVRWTLGADNPAVVARHDGDYAPAAHVYRAFRYREEAARGYDAEEDLPSPGEFRFDLRAGRGTLVFAAEGHAAIAAAGPDIAAAARALAETERHRRLALGSPLRRAAAAYLVRRGAGKTVVAGYPWFTDWGRDTFLALRGLCLSPRRLGLSPRRLGLSGGDRGAARDVLCEWARHVDGGMLPNRFPDGGEAPEYHSADAALWFVVTAHEYLTGGPVAPADRRALGDAILAIVRGHAAGTRHGIAMAEDALLRAGAPGLNLTWMDAIVDGKVVTPRIGKPIELQALWYNALRTAGAFEARWHEVADRVADVVIARFWDAAKGYLCDVADEGHVAGRRDERLRPNQILAVGGLPWPLVTGLAAHRVVDAVERELLTPLGLRTLAPSDPGYAPVYAGDTQKRDLAYHNGTVWPWLLGPFVDAWLRVHGDDAERRAEAKRRFLAPLRAHLGAAGLGHVSEIADADAPHTPRGCPFQAWSTGELLRMEHRLAAAPTPRSRRANTANHVHNAESP